MYWVIEGNKVYWCGAALDDFKSNMKYAVRFARQQDGEKVLAWILSKDAKALCRVVQYEDIERTEDIYAT